MCDIDQQSGRLLLQELGIDTGRHLRNFNFNFNFNFNIDRAVNFSWWPTA